MNGRDFSKKIISWYQEHKRNLPWRSSSDPYFIWLSEVILQQTRVAQGLPYFERFVRDFPNVRALANAPLEKILRAWQGLGYYSRARNLHRCAQVIRDEHGGQFPRTYSQLLSLPGIGSYTAAAISSIAFGEAHAVVDGNVFRVIARIFGFDHDTSTAEGKKKFEERANQLLDRTQPGVFNQAVMEFGALHCTPKSPACGSCIFAGGCFARKHEAQMLLPVKSKKVKIRARHFQYFAFKVGSKLALKQRTAKDIWHGLYDFLLIEGKEGAPTDIRAFSMLKSKGTEIGKKLTLKHQLTHQSIKAEFTLLDLPNTRAVEASLKALGLKLYSSRQLANLPKPVLISRFLADSGILD